MTFGERLKQLRESRDITQQELADYLGVGRPTVAGYETKGKQPDYDKLKQISDFFNVSIDYLLGRTNESPNIEETEKVIKQAEDAYKIDPEMLIQMCRATELPEEERKRIKEYSAYVIEKYLREKVEKAKQDDK